MHPIRVRGSIFWCIFVVGVINQITLFMRYSLSLDSIFSLTTSSLSCRDVGWKVFVHTSMLSESCHDCVIILWTLVACVIADSSHIVMACNLICLVHIFFCCICDVALCDALCNNQKCYCDQHTNRCQNYGFVICSLTNRTACTTISTYFE